MVNPARSDKIIQFLETLRLPDGTYGGGAGSPFVLRDWQKDIIKRVYDPQVAHDYGTIRQVQQAILSVPRKNGKTALVAGLCLCHLCGPERVKNGQLYSLSVDREQAGILFRYAANMVYQDPELSEHLNVIESRKIIRDPYSGSEYIVLSGEKKGKMGKSSSLIFFDELAEFGADRDLYEALMTSRGAHLEPLVWVFSTQAPSDNAVLSELIDYGEKVNSGEIDDPTFVSILYSAPEDADPWSEETWRACNPALGDFKNIEVMREEARKAREMPSAENSFRNLHLNQRVDTEAPFVTRTTWQKNGEKVDERVFEENPVFCGLDLSGKNDLTAFVMTARDEAGSWHAKCHFWTPGEGLADKERRDRAPYRLWHDQGFLHTTPGPVVRYDYVARFVASIAKNCYNKRIVVRFDRWRIHDFLYELEKIGANAVVATIEKDKENNSSRVVIPEDGDIIMVPFGQGFRDMSPALETLEDLLVQAHIRHENNPVLTWCASNVRVQSDPSGNRKFDKKNSISRIDGMVALAMALSGAETFEFKKPVEPMFFSI